MQNRKINKLYDYIHENLNLWLVVFLGFLIRLYASMHVYVINTDSAYYIYQAQAISANMWDAAKSCGYTFVSLYPFFIIPFQKIFSDWIIAARAVSVFFGLITLIPLYFLIKRFFSKAVTVIVLIIFAFNPLFVRENTEIMKDSVFWFFLVFGLYLFVRAADKDKNKTFILSSLSFCLASLARIEGAIFFLCSFLYLVFKKNRDIKHILSFGFPLIALILTTFSSFFISEDGHSLWSLYILPRLKALAYLNLSNPFDNAMTKKLVELNSQQIESIPPNFFKYIKLNLWVVALGIFLTKTVPAFYLPFFALFLLGFKGLKKEIRKEPLTKYLFFLSVIAFIYLYLFILKSWVMEKRYVASFIYSSFIITGLGVQNIIDFLKGRGLRENLLIPFLCVLVIAVTLPDNLKFKREEQLSIKEIGEFLAAENKNIQVATSDVRVNFYANKFRNDLECPAPPFNYKELTQKKYPELVVLLKEKNIDYFLWEENYWRLSPYDFLKTVSDKDMAKIGQWEFNENKLVLFKITKGK